ncbi:MAG: DUF167 domain-containing protein [Solirubrobacterales bacterium]
MAADGCVSIPIRVIPRAKRSGVGGEREGRLLVRVAAPPVGGKANAAVVAALAEALGVPKRSVEIVRGVTSRDKVVRVAGVAADDPRLAALR